MIDEAGSIAAGKALDIQQAGAIEGFHARVEGSQDLTRVTGCTVCIVADSGRALSRMAGRSRVVDDGAAQRFYWRGADVFAGAGQAGLLQAVVRKRAISATASSAPLPKHSPRPPEPSSRSKQSVHHPKSPSACSARLPSPGTLERRSSRSPGTRTAFLPVPERLNGVPPPASSFPGAKRQSGVTRWNACCPGAGQTDRSPCRPLWPPGPQRSVSRPLGSLKPSLRLRAGARVLTVLGGEFGVRNRVGCCRVCSDQAGSGKSGRPR